MLEKTVRKSTRHAPRHVLRDQLLRWMVYATVAVISLVFLWILFDLVRGGATHLSWRFWLNRHGMPAVQVGLDPFWSVHC